MATTLDNTSKFQCFFKGIKEVSLRSGFKCSSPKSQFRVFSKLLKNREQIGYCPNTHMNSLICFPQVLLLHSGVVFYSNSFYGVIEVCGSKYVCT